VCVEGRVSAYRWSRHPLRCRRPFGRPLTRPPAVDAWPPRLAGLGGRRLMPPTRPAGQPYRQPHQRSSSVHGPLSNRAVLFSLSPQSLAVRRAPHDEGNTFADGVHAVIIILLYINNNSAFVRITILLKKKFFGGSKVPFRRHVNNLTIIILISIVIIMTSCSFRPRNMSYAITCSVH